jgi:hypothetical protein
LNKLACGLTQDQTLKKKKPVGTKERVNECKQVFLHVDTRKVLRPVEIYVLQRSKPDVLQISMVSA